MFPITIERRPEGLLLRGPSATGSELLVPHEVLPALVEQLHVFLGAATPPHGELLAALEPLLSLAYHLSDATADTPLYRDAHVLLTVGDVQRLAQVVHRLCRAGQL
jgi:hypothetical protein